MFVAAWHSPPITGAVPRAPDVLDMPALAVREDPWMWLNIERGGILWTLINGGGVWPVLEEPTSKVARPPAIGPAHIWPAGFCWLVLLFIWLSTALQHQSASSRLVIVTMLAA